MRRRNSRKSGSSFVGSPQGEHVQKEADQTLGLDALALRDGRADTDLLLPRVAGEEALKSCEKQREERDVFRAAERAKFRREFGRKRKLPRRSAEARLRRARTIRGQGQRRMIFPKLAAPVSEMRGRLRSVEGRSLPVREVAILDRQLLQRTGKTIAEGSVERGQLAGEDGVGPHIAQDVVPCGQERVIVFTETDERHAPERKLREVERSCRLFGDQALQLGRTCFHDSQRLRRKGMDDLPGALARRSRKSGAQDFMAALDFLQAALQRGAVERAGHPPMVGNVVNALAGFELVQHPEALLPKRERDSFTAIGFRDRVFVFMCQFRQQFLFVGFHFCPEFRGQRSHGRAEADIFAFAPKPDLVLAQLRQGGRHKIPSSKSSSSATVSSAAARLMRRTSRSMVGHSKR